jgi:hypothetical protein
MPLNYGHWAIPGRSRDASACGPARLVQYKNGLVSIGPPRTLEGCLSSSAKAARRVTSSPAGARSATDHTGGVARRQDLLRPSSPRASKFPGDHCGDPGAAGPDQGTARTRAHAVVDQSPSMRTTTRTAMSSNEPSTTSRTGADSRAATTSTPWSTRRHRPGSDHALAVMTYETRPLVVDRVDPLTEVCVMSPLVLTRARAGAGVGPFVAGEVCGVRDEGVASRCRWCGGPRRWFMASGGIGRSR